MKQRTIKTSFTGGELSPALYGRVDTELYQNAAAILKNVIVMVKGGATRRPGTRYVSNAGEDITVRLIEFDILRTDLTPPAIQGYVIEFRSDNTIRFNTNGAQILDTGVPYEIASPFEDADLSLIRYRGNDNSLYLVHPDFPPQQLTRTDDTNWTIADMALVQPGTVFWDGTNGYPGSITFYEQRLVFAYQKINPRTVWLSETGVILNFVPGTAADDPFTFTMMDARAPIYHLDNADRRIVMFTGKEEIFLQGDQGYALTPTTPDIRVKTKRGCKEAVRPINLGNELIFSTKLGKALRALAYEFVTDSYKALDRSIVSDHLLSDGIKEMAYTVEPEPLIWVITTTGDLITITYDKESETVSFTKHITDGLFKSMCPISTSSNDQVWFSIEREIDGTTYTYIEYMPVELFSYKNTDCAYVGTAGTAKALWDGLDHLEGKTVDILADNIVMPQQVVTGGEITLPRTANSVEIGLHYESHVKELPLSIQTDIGLSPTAAISINSINVYLYNSIGCEVNGDVVPFRKFGEGVLDEPVSLFTGYKQVPAIGWNDGAIEIKQTQPLPFTVLNIIKEVTVNNG